MFSLPGLQDLWPFEREIAALIARSKLSQAEDRVRQAIGLEGSASLKAVSDVPIVSLRFEGWPALCIDLVKANCKMRLWHWERVKLMVLNLENDRGIPRLQFERYFHTNYSRAENGYIRGERNWTFRSDGSVHVSGLEALMAVQRTRRERDPIEEAPHRQREIDRLLAGLLLVIRIHQSFDRTLAARGLPFAVDVVIDTSPSKPYPNDHDDLGPHTRRFIAAQSIASS